jgi:uroporphyrin-III C-methyltransferase
MNRSETVKRVGKAYLVGAGPGDPRLLTLRAVDALGEADLILVDDLVGDGILEYAKPGARIVRVGKRCGRHSVRQEVTTRVLVSSVRRGATVVRLKGGDPFVFGRGGEEAQALALAGLSFEIVPGVTSALGAAAAAGVPLTCRGIASSVAFVAGHARDGADATLASVAGADTIVVFMAQRTLAKVAADLLEHGRAPATPVAIVRAATTHSQQLFAGTLAELARLPEDHFASLDDTLPTIGIIGDVVSLATTALPSINGELPAPTAVGF